MPTSVFSKVAGFQSLSEKNSMEKYSLSMAKRFRSTIRLLSFFMVGTAWNVGILQASNEAYRYAAVDHSHISSRNLIICVATISSFQLFQTLRLCQVFNSYPEF